MHHKKNKNKIIFGLILILIILMVSLGLVYLYKHQTKNLIDKTPFLDESGRLVVVTTLFPVFDFAKIVGGDKANVSLILPPGLEAHSFKPLPKDYETIKKAALFFYTSTLMESWAQALKNKVSAKTQVVSVAEGLNDGSLDPHVWLDFSKASLMVDIITANYQRIDPQNSNYYQNNAEVYKKQLVELDSKFIVGLKNCRFSEFISGGHYTFGYLAKRYNLKYQASGGFSPDLNLDVAKLIALGKELKTSEQPYVYYEELILPHSAEILRQESGAQLMPLNAAHNVGKYDISGGLTFIKVMENDLKILKRGLKCPLVN